MRFKTRYDGWLVVLLVIIIIATVLIPAGKILLTGEGSSFFILFSSLVFLLGAIFSLPQHYEIRENGLFIRQGIRKWMLPFDSITELQSMHDGRSTAVFSMQRILVVTKESQKILIAVAEEQRFVEEMMIRCPQLERKAYGLGVPLASPTSL